MKMHLPCAGGLLLLSVVKCILTEDDCNLSRVKSSSSLVPRKKDTFGHSHTISLVESSMEKLLKTCPTQVGDEPRDWLQKPHVGIMLSCCYVVVDSE